MITKIILNKIASYSEEAEIIPNKINYFFGGNGSGKSSLSKVITNPENYRDCRVVWESNPIETPIYNREFVRNNFSLSKEIKGIFTLGLNSTEAVTQIDSAKKEIEKTEERIKTLSFTLEKKKQELLGEEKKIYDKSWKLKVEYEEFFKPAFVGSMGSTKAFFEKCESELSNAADLLKEEDIKRKCELIYSGNLKLYPNFNPLEATELSQKEENTILSLPIVGKEDIELDILIKKMNNSDWVREGIGYLSEAGDMCPFCQQSLNIQLKKSLESIFDDTYTEKITLLQNFKNEYNSYVDNLINIINGISTQEIEIIDYTSLKEKIKLLIEEHKNNNNIIDNKLRLPSTTVSLNSLKTTIDSIAEIVNQYIETIKHNNQTLENINEETKKLRSEIWKFINYKLEIDYQSFTKFKKGNLKAQESLTNAISTYSDKKSSLENQIKEKEGQITTVKHSANIINKMLNKFGYTNFNLAEAEKSGFYKIIREDGTDAKETLSEGEYNLVTFLYFYHLLKGSTNNTGATGDKVIIIDDPISSLDSNALFIVSNLIKGLINGVKNGTQFKQIFILTHNVYFFKEVTFKGNRESKWSEESYWIVDKLNNKSRIAMHDINPIQTTYELLWQEIRDPSKVSLVTIFNTLRRILEYYFKILGGINYEAIVNNFEGEELIICRSLISWMNDGSHFVHDDLVVSTDTQTIEKYLAVFKLIFEKLGHDGHYHMMIKSPDQHASNPKTMNLKGVLA